MPWWRFPGRGSSNWNIETLPIPWAVARASIHDHIVRHIEPGKDRLREGGDTLPDEDIFAAGQQIRFAPGAFDGVFGHHSRAEQEPNVAQAFHTLGRALSDPTAANLQALYNLLCEESLLHLLDPLIEKIAETKDAGSIPPDRLFELANFFALQAPDRGPVKFAIAMLGLFEASAAGEVVMMLGRHEEFTLFSAVAIEKQADDPELQLWELAKGVNGWGRIHCVERLDGTKHPAIKAWLLRDGFRNSVMYEYLAHIAAGAGGLVEELRAENPDDALLAGAGDMLAAMANGPPGPGMQGYAAAAEATELYLKHMDARAQTLADLLSITTLRDYAGRGDGWEASAEHGWSSERRETIVAMADRIIARPEWRARIATGLEDDDSRGFWRARAAAERLGIDTWDASFQRQERGLDENWYQLMQTDDPGRIDRVLALAESVLPLDQIATGPGTELGFSHAFRHHSALDYIVQELGRFPGKGWAFVRAALQSPVIRNRIHGNQSARRMATGILAGRGA